jgi:hypothetical protein
MIKRKGPGFLQTVYDFLLYNMTRTHMLQKLHSVRLEALAVVTTKETVNWDMTSQSATEQAAVSRRTQYYPSYTLTSTEFLYINVITVFVCPSQ